MGGRDVTEPRKPGRPKGVKNDNLAVYCKAHKKNGDQCRNPPIKGATVCRFHGGANPAVRRKAKERLLAAVDPLMADLLEIAHDKKRSDADRLKAITWALERAGFSARDSAASEPAPWQVLISKIVIEDPDGQIHVTSDGAAGRGRYRPPIEAIVEGEVVEDDPEAEASPPAEPVRVNGDDQPPRRLDPDGLASQPRRARMKR
jgi:hypothetical protein